MPLEFRNSVLVQSSIGEFVGRTTGPRAAVMVSAGMAEPVGKIRGKPVKVIRLLESIIDETKLKSMGQDSRRLTWTQNVEGHEVTTLKRYDPRNGAFWKDDKI